MIATFLILLSSLILLFCLILYFLILLTFLVFDIKNQAFFVPSNKKLINQLFEKFPFQKDKIFIDLGSGDGRVVFAAAKKNLNAFGYENNPLLYFLAQLKKKFFKIDNAKFIRQSFLKADISSADYIYVYLLPKVMLKIEDFIFSKAKKGCQIISLDFQFPHKKYKEKILNRFYVYEV